MQFLRSCSVLSLLFSMVLFVMSCGGNAAAGEEDAAADQTEQAAPEGEASTEAAAPAEAAHGEGKEYTSAYVCPMHCSGSGSDEAGKCPVCNMDYVALAEHTENGHKH